MEIRDLVKRIKNRKISRYRYTLKTKWNIDMINDLRKMTGFDLVQEIEEKLVKEIKNYK